MKKYDALYIFVGTAREEAVQELIDKATAEIARLEGVILSQEILGRHGFAHPMKKRESGVYAKVRFELDPAKIAELVNRYRLVEDVFRVQILAVEERREAKLSQQREEAARRAEAKARKEAEAAAVAESAS